MTATSFATASAAAGAGQSAADRQLARRQRLVLVCSATVAVLAAWLWLVRTMAPLHAAMLGPHAHHHAHGDTFLVATLMWLAMTVAMMTPTVLHWLLAFAKFTSGTEGRRFWLAPAGAFASGYFVIWTVYSVGGAALQIGLQHLGWLPAHGRLAAPVAGGVLIAAGLLQFAPFKDSCLRHCRSPLTYFLTRWSNGPVGGFRLGLSHGAYCVGCCWALMLTGFAMGVMNLAWMAVLTVIICLEQIAPRGNRVSAGFGVALAVWGGVLMVR